MKMTSKILSSKLRKKLDEQLKEINDRFSHINAGGCAYFAVALQKKLRESGLKPRIYILSNGKLASYVNQSRTNVTAAQANRAGYSIAHVLIRLGKYYVDSTGVISDIKKTKWLFYKGGYVKLEKEEAIKGWLKEKDRWNPMFDKKQLKAIYSAIDEIQI